jgi:DNA-binding NarL/FixJ family response regulator
MRATRSTAMLGGGVRCLIVDDNHSFLEVSRALLEGEGVNVVGIATTVVEGLARARELGPDVILVDIDLGDESGLELGRCLADEQRVGANMILMSAHSEDEFVDLIEETGAAGFLAKTALSRQAIETVLASRPPSEPPGRR